VGDGAQMDLAPGHYFWRIASPNQPLTEASAFTIASVQPVKPTYPSLSDRLLSYGGETPIQFRWAASLPHAPEEAEDLAENTLEVARDLEFKHELISEKIDASSGTATLRKIPEGSYFWRIKSKYADISVLSGVEKFKVDRAKKIDLDLAEPAQASHFEVRPEVKMVWNAAADAPTYQIDIRSSDGKPVVSEKLSTYVYHWLNPVAGAYEWKVTAFNSASQPIGESAWNHFSMYEGKPLALLQPKNNDQILYWENPKAFKFSWSSDSGVEAGKYRYLFEIAKDPEFKSIAQSKNLTSAEVASQDLSLEAGHYFWRVKVVDASGMSIKTSPAQNLTYGLYPTLAAPEMTAPEVGEQFHLMDEHYAPTASWSAIDGAEAYDVSVVRVDGRNPASSSGSSEKVVEHQTLTDRQLDLKKLPPGQYKVIVRSVDRMKRVGDAEVIRNFSIDYGHTLAPPEPISPEVQ
jgi:hypothetical protein